MATQAPLKPPPPGAKKTGLKAVPKWVWIVAALLAVGVFIYLKRSSSSTSANTGVPPQGGGSGVDESQLSSDIAAQLAAALVGTPDQGGAVSSPDQSQLDQDLLALIQQSQGDYNSLVTQLVGSGLVGPGTPTQQTQPISVTGTQQFAPASTDPYNLGPSPFAVTAAPNTAGIAGIVNPGAPVPNVYLTSGQNITGYAGVIQPSPSITPSRTGPARAM